MVLTAPSSTDACSRRSMIDRHHLSLLSASIAFPLLSFNRLTRTLTSAATSLTPGTLVCRAISFTASNTASPMPEAELASGGRVVYGVGVGFTLMMGGAGTASSLLLSAIAGSFTSSTSWSDFFVTQPPGHFLRRKQSRIKSAPITPAIENPVPMMFTDGEGEYDGGGSGDGDGDGDGAGTDVGERDGMVLVEGDKAGDMDEDVGGVEGEGLSRFVGSGVGERENGTADGAGVGNAEGAGVVGLEISITSMPSTPPLVLFPPKDPRL